MTETPETPPPRSYGCTFGCGNPYDYIVVTVGDGSTEMLCLPCYVRLALDMVAAVTEPGNPDVRAALLSAGNPAGEQVPGPAGKSRGHNAPATTTDSDIFSAFDDVITVDDLPEEFR